MADGGILDLITAAGPAAEHGDALMLFGQLVGSWAVTSTRFDPGGPPRTTEGAWHFTWILDGCGVQDVLLPSGPGSDGCTALRCYDPAIDVWHVTSMRPSYGMFAHMKARPEAARIVLEGLDVRNGRPLRGSFDDISEDAFVWRGLELTEDGSRWTVRHEISARRRRG